MRITWKKKNIVCRCDLCDNLIRYGDSYFVEWDLEASKSKSLHWECYEKNEIYWASFHNFWGMLGSRYHNDCIWWDKFGVFWTQLGDYLNPVVTIMDTFLTGDLLYTGNTPIQPNYVQDVTWVAKINKSNYNEEKKTKPTVKTEPPTNKQPLQIISEIMGVIHQCLTNELLHKLSDAAARGLMLDLD